MTNTKRTISLAATLVAAALLAGCAGAKVQVDKRASDTLPRPDMFIVHDFAVTPGEVKLDSGIMATALRDAKGREPGADEAEAGRMVARKLTEKLVADLNAMGVIAVPASSGITPGPQTAVITGQFVQIDEGNQSARVWVGFGIGGGELRTRVQLVQAGQLVAQADTRTTSSLMPGMAVGLATGAAAGKVAEAAVVGGVSAGARETLSSSIEAGATRTAKQIAARVKEYYRERGWSVN